MSQQHQPKRHKIPELGLQAGQLVRQKSQEAINAIQQRFQQELGSVGQMILKELRLNPEDGWAINFDTGWVVKGPKRPKPGTIPINPAKKARR